MNEYVERVAAQLQARYATEPEYLQSVLPWLTLIAPVVDRNPAYERLDLLTRMVEPERLVEPERVVMFRVSRWTTTAPCRSTAATASSTAWPLAPTRAVCGFTPR